MKNGAFLALLLTMLLLTACAAPGGSAVSTGQSAAGLNSGTVSSGVGSSEQSDLNNGPALPELEVSDTIEIPELAGWALCEGERADLSAAAEAAAKSLFGEFTTENESADGAVRYYSEVTETPHGDYQQQISLTEDALSFRARWLDTEESPFHQDPAVGEETAVQMAREFAKIFGLEDIVAGEPTVKPENNGADHRITWLASVDGLPVARPAGTLTIRVIGDDVVTLSMDRTTLVPAGNGEAPAGFLSLEEAVYCINYARSLAPQDSIFYEAQDLAQVELIWTRQFVDMAADGEAYAVVDYTPAYAFSLTDGTGRVLYTVYVDAYTGAVETGTNEGGYPSPFRTE